MFMRKAVFCASIALSAIAMPAVAQVSMGIEIAPPPPRYEVVPAPREGYVWGPGYWRYENERHVWAPGQWQTARPGSVWVADHWESRDGRNFFIAGHWDRR